MTLQKHQMTLDIARKRNINRSIVIEVEGQFRKYSNTRIGRNQHPCNFIELDFTIIMSHLTHADYIYTRTYKICYLDSCDKQQRIFCLHYHTDMVIHVTAFVLVSNTGRKGKKHTGRTSSLSQSKQTSPGAYINNNFITLQ